MVIDVEQISQASSSTNKKKENEEKAEEELEYQPTELEDSDNDVKHLEIEELGTSN